MRLLLTLSFSIGLARMCATSVCADVVVKEFPREGPSSDTSQDSANKAKSSGSTKSKTAAAAAADEYLRSLREAAQKSAAGKGDISVTISTEQVKLDFIPAAERQERTELGYKRLTVPKGTYGVEGHGAPRKMYYKSGEVLTAAALSRWIRNDPRYEPGMAVYLLACETGKGPNPFAQDLADALQADVFAPTEKLWIQRDQSYSINQGNSKAPAGRKLIKGTTDADLPGVMRVFHPLRSK